MSWWNMFSVASPASLFAGVSTRADEEQLRVCFVGNDSV